jgi:RNA polymerase sigma factor (sigma-70 family)
MGALPCCGCKEWNDGEGTGECFKCKKIKGLLPSMNRGNKSITYLPHDYLITQIDATYDTDTQEILQHCKKYRELFTPRQKEVMKLRMEGLSHRAIAARLGMSRGSVYNSIKKCMKKVKGI